MKKLIILFVSAILVSCTNDLGRIHTLSTQEFKIANDFELAVKQMSFTGTSLEACSDAALRSVPRAALLKNVSVTTKGKKVTMVADIWVMTKGTSQKNKDLKVGKYKEPKGQTSQPRRATSNVGKFKAGMKVTWDHPKAGKGSGILAKIMGEMAQIEKVVDANGKQGKPIKLHVSVLKPIK
jgi:hypothetical protein